MIEVPGSGGPTVAVAGATGVVGGHVVGALRRRGVAVAPMARSLGVDLVGGRGVDAALRGATAVIDVGNVASSRRSTAVRYFTRATTTLLDACRRHGVERYVLLSIVGIDDVASGYYLGKREQERLVAGSGLETVILRATQFHEFAGQALDRLRWGPVALVPTMLSRPVAAAAVGERLVDLALEASPPARVELAGPECLPVAEMVRRLCRRRGDRVLLVPVRVPGAVGRAMAGGALVPAGAFETDPLTFDRWLADLPPER
jgi:uncharacterized protein YbjT (DUF2867 family)